jgi:hypothetical protein
VICLLLYHAANAWARATRRASGISEIRRKLINNGLLHTTRIAAFLWRGDDSFGQPTATLQRQIAILQTTPSVVNTHFDDALNRLQALINVNPGFVNDVDGALKSALLETAITRSLHTTPAAATATAPQPGAIPRT